MSLADPKYLVFLGIAVAVFYLLREGGPRAVWLLVAGYLFYFNLAGWYGCILPLVTAIAYAAGLLLDPRRKAPHRDLIFASACVALLIPLITFKYLGFLVGISAGLSHYAVDNAPLFTLALPVGISFFTFVALGYTIDVYLEVVEPEYSLLKFGLFLSLFPIVTAGPIERAGGLLPQLDLAAPFFSDRALSGCRNILIGLFLKIVCADNLLQPVTAFFASPAGRAPVEQWWGMIQFTFYVYTDFAGYSLIAIGSAELLGLKIRPNFQQPFLSATIPEFWRRWHISLSSWVRDYLFTPIRMRARRYPNAGLILALMLSFAILGVWHGAGWGFALFGLMHGSLAVASTYTLRQRDAVWKSTGMPWLGLRVWRTFCTFILVTLTFVVYRANSLGDAAAIYRGLFSPRLLKSGLPHGGFDTRVAVSIIAVVIVGDILLNNGFTIERFPRPVQFLAYNAMALLIIYGWLSVGAGEPFLYYRF
jgi:alginate O-acetyltransferase complex protein AlgI